MTVINLFFNLPDEIKTIIWQYDPTYTIVKRDLCYFLRRVSIDFYSYNKNVNSGGLRGLVAFGRGEELPVPVVSPSYVKESLIHTKQLWKSLGIQGPKTVKDILHCSEEDKECKDYLNLYIRSIHKINRPVPDAYLYTNDEIRLIIKETGCTMTQAINALMKLQSIKMMTVPHGYLYTNDEISLIIKETGCTMTQAINAFKNKHYDWKMQYMG